MASVVPEEANRLLSLDIHAGHTLKSTIAAGSSRSKE